MRATPLLRALLRPSAAQLLIFLLLAVLSTLTVTHRAATTKVTWDEKRGFPLTAARLEIIAYGPCTLNSPDCQRHLTHLSLPHLLINLLLIYLLLGLLRWIREGVMPV